MPGLNKGLCPRGTLYQPLPSYALDVGKGDALFGDSPCVHSHQGCQKCQQLNHGAWHCPLNLKMLEACGHGHVTQQPNTHRGVLGGCRPWETDPSVQGRSKPEEDARKPSWIWALPGQKGEQGAAIGRKASILAQQCHFCVERPNVLGLIVLL